MLSSEAVEPEWVNVVLGGVRTNMGLSFGIPYVNVEPFAPSIGMDMGMVRAICSSNDCWPRDDYYTVRTERVRELLEQSEEPAARYVLRTFDVNLAEAMKLFGRGSEKSADIIPMPGYMTPGRLRNIDPLAPRTPKEPLEDPEEIIPTAVIKPEDLTESRKLRDQYLDRVDALDVMGNLEMLPDGEHTLIEMVARYYQMRSTSLNWLLSKNADEFWDNGYRLVERPILKQFKQDNNIRTNVSSLRVFNRRAALTMGMLLADSPVAQRLRVHLIQTGTQPPMESELIELEDSAGAQGLQIFDVEGHGIRFGTTEAGRPYAVAADYAKMLSYSSTQMALKIIDPDEKGQEYVRIWVASQINHAGQSSGEWQNRKQWVIFEDGLWELIFRSTLPGAKAIKKRVKAILREIRETGSYSVAPVIPPVPKNFADALELAARQAREIEAISAENAVLKPKADAFDEWLDGEGCYLVGSVAKMLGILPNALWNFLYDEKILIKAPGTKRHREPYSRPELVGWFKINPVPPERANGHDTQTTMVTAYGAERIRLRLIKRGVLLPQQPPGVAS